MIGLPARRGDFEKEKYVVAEGTVIAADLQEQHAVQSSMLF